MNKQDLIDQKINLIAYLTSKIKAGDWHAVQDAASDIREIDAKLEVVSEQEERPQEQERWAKRLG